MLRRSFTPLPRLALLAGLAVLTATFAAGCGGPGGSSEPAGENGALDIF